jgi:hypothetical protein
MTRIIDERVTRLETGYRDGLYMNRWRYHDRDREFNCVLPLEVPLPDHGLWQPRGMRKPIDYGNVIAEWFNTELRKLKRKDLIRTVET